MPGSRKPKRVRWMKKAGFPCSHKNTVMDLLDWCRRCQDCGEEALQISEAEGNEYFTRIMGLP